MKFVFDKLSVHQIGENDHSYHFKMYGSTMEYYNEKLYILGNGELMETEGYFTLFDLATNMWSTTSSAPPNDVLPNNRVFHCSFLYEVCVFSILCIYWSNHEGTIFSTLAQKWSSRSCIPVASSVLTDWFLLRLVVGTIGCFSLHFILIRILFYNQSRGFTKKPVNLKTL